MLSSKSVVGFISNEVHFITTLAIVAISTDSGIAGDQKTNDQTLIFTGTAQASNLVTVYRNGVAIGTTTANGSGTWTFDYSGTSLAEGTYSFTAQAKDGFGTLSLMSAPLTVIIDITPPAIPLITSISDDTGTPADWYTKDQTLLFHGTSGPSEKVDLYRSGIYLGSTTADAAGNWTFDFSGSTLPTGAFNYTARVSDGANTSISPSRIITIDTTLPAAPVISSWNTDTDIPGDNITSNSKPAFIGKAEVRAIVTLYMDGAILAVTKADGGGNFAFISATPIPEGTHSFTARATDEAGNEGTLFSAPLTISFVYSTPAIPVLLAISDDTGTPGDFITADQTLIFNGTSDPNNTITIHMGSVLLGSAVADATGNWTFDYSHVVIPEGVYTFKVTASNGAKSAAIYKMIRIDSTSPTMGIVNITTDSGTPGDHITSDQTIQFNGTAEPGAYVTVFKDGVLIGAATANGVGLWALPYTSFTLPEGSYTFTAQAKNPSGSISNSSPFVVKIDITPPKAVITAISDDTGTPENHSTADQTLIFTGTSEPHSTVTMYKDGVVIGTCIANAAGDWTFDYRATTLPEGSYIFSAEAADGAFIVPGDPFNVKIDLVPPLMPVITAISTDSGNANDFVTSDQTLLLSGTGEANDTAFLYQDGIKIGDIAINSAGVWTFDYTITALPEGTYNFKIEDAFDGAHIVSSIQTVTIDNTPPLIASGQTLVVVENSPKGTYLGRVAVMESHVLKSYVLTSNADPDGDGNFAFSIDPVTGIIVVNDEGDLDSELNDFLLIEVQASDMAENISMLKTVKVILTDVNDNTPVIADNQTFTLDKVDLNGAIAGALKAEDADRETTFQNWTIVSGNSSGIFKIDETTGQLVVINSFALNIESEITLTLGITVSDGLNTSAVQTITINLEKASDNLPSPSEIEPMVNRVVTPNGDGINDFLSISGIENLPENRVVIFTRTGSPVFTITNYNNQDRIFRGLSRGLDLLSAGTYFYSLEFKVGGTWRRKAGYFLLAY